GGIVRHAWRSADRFEILGVTYKSNIKDTDLCKALLDPLLFFLALTASTATDSIRESAATWLGRRALRVHLAHAQGIAGFAYTVEDFTAAQARAYLEELLRDFLDRLAFDRLPLELIIADDKLKLAYVLPDGESELAAVRAQYLEAMQDAYAQDQENSWRPAYEPSDIVQMMDLEPPA